MAGQAKRSYQTSLPVRDKRVEISESERIGGISQVLLSEHRLPELGNPSNKP